MSNPAQNRPALGDNVGLGTLYDAKRDVFLSSSLLSRSPPQSSLTIDPKTAVDFQCCPNGTYQSKFKVLGVNQGLGASYLAHLLSSNGWQDYLGESVDTDPESFEKSLIFTLSTCQERLGLMDPQLRDCISVDSLCDGTATHVVSEVHWGFQAAVIATSQQNHTASKSSMGSTVEEHVDFQFAALQSLIGRDATATAPDFTSDQRVSYTVRTDERIAAAFTTSNFDHVAKFLQNLVTAATINGTQGQPINYVLLPLGLLTYFLSVPAPPTLAVVESPCLDRVIELFEDTRVTRHRLSKYLTRLQGHRFCVSDSHMNAVTIASAKASQADQLLRSKIANSLVSVRSGEAPSNDILTTVGEFEHGPLAPGQFKTLIGELDEKMAFIDLVSARGCQYEAFNPRRPWQFLTAEDTYVFFYYSDAAKQDKREWESHKSLMIDLLDNRRGACQVVLCDCDINGPTPKKLRITHLTNRKVVVSDLVDEEQFAADKSLAMCDLRSFHREDRPRPQHRRALKLPCPGPNCDPSLTQDWFCARCRSLIEFGDDKYLYCDCGYADHTGFGFKCKNSMQHGSAFERFKSKHLLNLLKGLEPYREMNVLILGETGVGKSTFINAFVNYLTFQTLDEAISHDELQWIIPCSFSTQYIDDAGKFHQQDVKVGHSADENDGSRGESATQSTTVYRIQMGDLIVRLIDTPGIGDTRGIEQDKRNFADILSTLASFDKLHGILILLKPNSARLTLMFKFCVTELLTHLHRDAARNMVFGFTNTRISNYMPGDAFKPLQSLLSKYSQLDMGLSHENTYCFDSESFRYLAALKQTGRSMDNSEDFRRSWGRSEEEAHRLLSHFQRLQPHGVQSTLSLNRARDLITKLTKPMAEIMDVINRTIRVNEDHVKELADERCKGDDLKKRLNFEKLDKIAKQLDKPRTVCTDNKCVDYVQGKDKMEVNYKTHCHKICYLTEVPKEIKGTYRLSGCAAFAGNHGKCNLCKHGWQSHMHVWYELELTKTSEKDPEIEAKIKKNESEIEIKKTAIKIHEQKIQNAKNELKTLEESAAQFGMFLKMNSITPYNDEMLAYLDEQIKEEKQIVNGTRTSQDRLNGLIRTRKEYEQQIRILEKEMQAGDSRTALSEEDVEKLVHKLYKLKGWGQSLKGIKTASEYYGGSTYHERHFRTHRPWGSDLRGVGPTGTYKQPSRSARTDSGEGSSSSGSSYDLYSGPQKYSSLIPSDEIQITSRWFAGADGVESRPRSSVIVGKPLLTENTREVETTWLSNKLRSGLGKLRKNLK